MIIDGHGLYGRVARLSNRWSFATKFVRLYWIALIPTGPSLIVERSGRNWRGIGVPLCHARALATLASLAAPVGVLGAIAGNSRRVRG